MATSQKQLAANMANAAKSTGPLSVAGKSSSARNATRHGLFCERSLIDGEDPAEFFGLVDDLISTLSPIGSLELALVEKIALTMWRQRRIANSEAATIRLRRRLPKVAKAVSSEMDRGFGNDLKPKDLVPFDVELEKWCRDVLAEYDGLDEIDIETLPDKAPTVYAHLVSDAETDGETIENTYGGYEHGLTGFVDHLVRWCRKELKTAEKRPTVLAVAEQVRARSQILDQRDLELLSRYQTTLDNQLYKAMRALRDAQEWRLKTLDMSPEGTTIVPAP